MNREGRYACLTRPPLSRRGFLQIGGSSVLGLSWAHLLHGQSDSSSYLAPTARSVVLVWLWGGPPHVDMWDPKPRASLEYRGPFGPIATRVPGFHVTELFPKLAERAGQFSVIRSMRTSSNDHGVAGTIGLTGSSSGGLTLGGALLAGSPRPTIGSVVARVRGAKPPLPPFLVVGGKLHQGKKMISGEGGGTLGAQYDPFRLRCDPEEGVHIPDLELSVDVPPERLGDRRRLVESLDSLERRKERIQKTYRVDEYRRQAFDLLSSPAARRTFDLSEERPEVLDRYGRTRFGHSCLLARRLVEHGVPFVQVNWSDHVEAEEDAGDGGWDHHYRNFQIMQDRHGPWLDQTLSAFLTDLSERGLLDQTLVIATGEFGRGPKINNKAGRDHWEHCYSALLAGGGVQGGRIIGASDLRGEHPIENPVTPADLAVTVQHCVGITTDKAAILGLPRDGQIVTRLF